MDVALPPAATTRQQSQAFRRRTGAVAAQQRPMLFDAKSIFAGGGRYRGSAEVREDQSGAVEQRARQVPSEYRRTAREKDQQYGAAQSTHVDVDVRRGRRADSFRPRLRCSPFRTTPCRHGLCHVCAVGRGL